MAIGNLRPPDATPVPFRFNAKFKAAEPIQCICRIIAFLLLIHYFTLHTVTLTFDLWPWTFATYRLRRAETPYRIWTQFSNPRRSYCDFSVWPYDFEHCVTCCARRWANFHQVWPSKSYPCLNFSVFMLIRCHAVTLTFDPMTLKVRVTSSG